MLFRINRGKSPFARQKRPASREKSERQAARFFCQAPFSAILFEHTVSDFAVRAVCKQEVTIAMAPFLVNWFLFVLLLSAPALVIRCIERKRRGKA